jgi:glycolate oxidase FAD binding subunit
MSPAGISVRVIVPASMVREMLGALQERGAVRTLAYRTTGMIVAEYADQPDESLASIAQELRACAVQCGGSLVVTSVRGSVKQHIDVWGDNIPGLDVMRRLKDQLDPNATLNPGRFLGGI